MECPQCHRLFEELILVPGLGCLCYDCCPTAHRPKTEDHAPIAEQSPAAA